MSDHKVSFLAVCSYGRSGSTVLMKGLRGLGAEVSGGLPFEDRTAQYCLVRWLGSLSGVMADPAASQFGVEFNQIGYGGYALRRETGTLEQRMSAWLAGVVQRSGRVGVAEKLVGFDVLRIWSAYDDAKLLRPIFLMRDPRDVFLSVKAFNKKRGSLGFDEGPGNVQHYQSIVGFELQQMALQQRIGGLVVRYEDLVMRPLETLGEIARYADVASENAVLSKALTALSAPEDGDAAHMTSESAAASVGRWKLAENAAYWPVFEQRAALLGELGYLAAA